jgi:hypothetical protein
MSYSAMLRLVYSREHRQEGEEAPCRVPLGRFGRPKDVAELAVLLITMGWLISQLVDLNSGISRHYL